MGEIIDKYLIKTAAELDNSEVEWLIPDWIPCRGITLLCSDGGIGKSFLWISVASALSKGNRTILDFGPVTRSEKTILCFSGEDPECILRRRFEDSAAKMDNILCVAQDSSAPEFSFNSPFVSDIIAKIHPDLMIFDPLQAFIGCNVDMSRRNQMRHAMKPLMTISSTYNLPVMVVVHTNKRQAAESGRDKMSDSADLWDIARSVIMLGYSDRNERYISLEKSSYSNHTAVDSVLFSLENGRVNYLDRVEKKMKDFIQDTKSALQAERIPSKKQQCADLILSILSENDGIVSGEVLDQKLAEAGYSSKTIRSGKELLRDSMDLFFDRLSNGKVVYRKTLLAP